MLPFKAINFLLFETIFKKANLFNETNMITNGLLLNDQKIDLLVKEKNFKVLAVSIDTIGNVNRDFKKHQWDFLVNQLIYGLKNF